MKLLYIENVASVKATSFYAAAVRAAHDQGIEFHIAFNCLDRTDEQISRLENEMGLTFHQVDFIRNPLDFRNVAAYRQVVDLMRRERFDVVHCNTPIGGVVGRLAAKRCGIDKVIYQAHGFHFYKGAPLLNWLVYYPVERWLAHMTDALITINREDDQRAQGFHLRNHGKAYYVPGVGIDVSAYAGEEGKREATRRSLGLLPEDFALISAGRLDRNKNNRVLVEAVAGLSSSIHLLICGEGEEKESLLALSQRLGCADRVHLLGNRTDMPALYKAADAFVMASYREGLSRSLMEAMTSGLPCVVSSIRGNVDLIEDGVNGFICAPDLPQAFANAIRALWDDAALRGSMRENNLQKIRAFSEEAVCEVIHGIYNSAEVNAS